MLTPGFANYLPPKVGLRTQLPTPMPTVRRGPGLIISSYLGKRESREEFAKKVCGKVRFTDGMRVSTGEGQPNRSQSQRNAQKTEG
jgi:hypothetical protein